jgi:hypothetical protein
MQIRKQLAVDEIPQIVPGQRRVVIQLAVAAFGRGSTLPAVRRIEDERIRLPRQRRHGRLILLQPVQIFQEQQPRGLLGTVQFRRASRLFAKRAVNVLEACSNTV